MTDPRETPSRSGYALVTGGAVRLGAAIVRRLAADGWSVAIHHRNSAAEADALVRELKAAGHDAVAVACDLSHASDLPGIFATANVALGFCSLLINSAAIFEYDDIGTIADSGLSKHFATNLRAPVLLAHHFAGQLPKDAKGLVINVLDQKVFNLNPDFLSYSIMKSALAAATELLAMALAPQIRVCGVAPGLTLRSGNQTEQGFEDAHAMTLLGLGNTPGDITEAMSFLIRVPSITGTTIVVDGGQHLAKRSHDVMFSYGIGGATRQG
jgi:NAD(P)-dependent dehydrogenase (short-subunit alcohol dehydrogenase family)